MDAYTLYKSFLISIGIIIAVIIIMGCYLMYLDYFDSHWGSYSIKKLIKKSFWTESTGKFEKIMYPNFRGYYLVLVFNDGKIMLYLAYYFNKKWFQIDSPYDESEDYLCMNRIIPNVIQWAKCEIKITINEMQDLMDGINITKGVLSGKIKY